jgi:hypothetical protein
MSAGLVGRLTASGGTESAGEMIACILRDIQEYSSLLSRTIGFLNDIVEQLWPNINIVACKMVKDIVEPMFATMLPGPLASLKFVKLDLGSVPMKIDRVDTHKTDNGAIKLDMDVIWEGQSDIELDGNMIPKVVSTTSFLTKGYAIFEDR